MEQTSSEKASTLLQIIGVGDKLFELERAEKETYNQRHAIGQIAEQKKKYAAEMIHYDNVPNEIISAKDLIQQQQDILLKNAENKKKKEHLSDLLERKVVLENSLKKCIEELEIAQMEAKDLEDISTKEIEENINNIDAINVKIRSNLDKEKAEDEAKHYSDQYEELSTRLEGIRQQKKSLLDNANLPLDELSVSEGEILYKGMKWDNMSGSDQLKVATAIVRKLNPECGFVLVDKLEQMDKDTMKEFAQWLENENLQVIATRVSTGDECSIIIEDGYVEGKENVNVPNAPTVKFKMGEF